MTTMFWKNVTTMLQFEYVCQINNKKTEIIIKLRSPESPEREESACGYVWQVTEH